MELFKKETSFRTTTFTNGKEKNYKSEDYFPVEYQDYGRFILVKVLMEIIVRGDINNNYIKEQRQVLTGGIPLNKIKRNRYRDYKTMYDVVDTQNDFYTVARTEKNNVKNVLRSFDSFHFVYKGEGKYESSDGKFEIQCTYKYYRLDKNGDYV